VNVTQRGSDVVGTNGKCYFWVLDSVWNDVIIIKYIWVYREVRRDYLYCSII